MDKTFLEEKIQELAKQQIEDYGEDELEEMLGSVMVSETKPYLIGLQMAYEQLKDKEEQVDGRT